MGNIVSIITAVPIAIGCLHASSYSFGEITDTAGNVDAVDAIVSAATDE